MLHCIKLWNESLWTCIGYISTHVCLKVISCIHVGYFHFPMFIHKNIAEPEIITSFYCRCKGWNLYYWSSSWWCYVKYQVVPRCWSKDWGLSCFWSLCIGSRCIWLHEMNWFTLLLWLQQVEETREDFSHLPPQQQKKRLQEQIDKVHEKIKNKTSER